MTCEQLNGYRTELLTLAGSLDRGLAHDRSTLRREAEPGGPMPATDDQVDDGTQEVELGLITSETRLLAEVTAALDRIDGGTFGTCADCGRKISQARLNALPYARQCVRCARTAKPVAG